MTVTVIAVKTILFLVRVQVKIANMVLQSEFVPKVCPSEKYQLGSRELNPPHCAEPSYTGTIGIKHVWNLPYLFNHFNHLSNILRELYG